jgi:hypothetical protein
LNVLQEIITVYGYVASKFVGVVTKLDVMRPPRHSSTRGHITVMATWPVMATWS